MPKDSMYFYIGTTDKTTNLTVGINSLEFSVKHFQKLSDIEEETQYRPQKNKKVLYKRDYNKK